MFKLPFFVFALGTVLYVVRYNNRLGSLRYRRVTRSIKSSISADPIIDQQMIAEGMKKIQLGVPKLMERLGGSGGGMEGALAKVTEIASKFIGKGRNRGQQERAKRSIETSYAETSMNKTDYRKVEMKNKRDNDPANQQVTEVTCLVKDNEIYWLELVTSALIHITQEMKKVLHGKAISIKMSRNA
ncbi:uncharacterized protein LOC135711610 [Ochlerotatus camptorhynchus]|uniref:uncharacterized protein LOC135711610 n=1 Tax=Ochlerotatus camptorhynchus TaxID=644619 RepID=UPI0031D12EF2